MPETEPWEYSLHIPSDPRAVTVCRRTLRLILTMHGLIRLVDVAELLATELISNSVRHAKGPAALRTRHRPSRRNPSPRTGNGRTAGAWPWYAPAPTSGAGSR